jgi:acyl carrier protein
LAAPRPGLVLLPRSVASTDPSATTSAVEQDARPEAAPEGPATGPDRPGTGSETPAAPAPDPRTLAAVFAAIDEINPQLPPGSRLDKSLTTPLQGAGGPLDSLGLVNLLVATEERLAAEFGVSITLTDERLVSPEESPLQTVGSLVAFIERVRRSG